MNTDNKLIRFFRNTGPARFLVPAGLFIIIFGIIMFLLSPNDMIETEATVTNSEIGYNINNEVENNLDITFEVDGVIHNNTLSLSDTTITVGDKIKIYYSESDPNVISNIKDSNLIGIILIVAGAVLIVGGIYSAVKNIKKDKALDYNGPVEDGRELKTEAKTEEEAKENQEYYFRYVGKGVKMAFILEDKDKNPIYEAKMTKFNLIGPCIYEFTNHEYGTKTEHKIGHTTTSEYNNELFSTNSYFKFDGTNCWDYFHSKGLRVQTDFTSKLPKLVYNLSNRGSFIGRVETSSMYVHEEDEEKHKINIPNKYYYRAWIDENNIENVFLLMFILTQVEQPLAR